MTTIKDWSAITAMMWAVPMASAGQRQRAAPANTAVGFTKTARISVLVASTSALALMER